MSRNLPKTALITTLTLPTIQWFMKRFVRILSGTGFWSFRGWLLQLRDSTLMSLRRKRVMFALN